MTLLPPIFSQDSPSTFTSFLISTVLFALFSKVDKKETKDVRLETDSIQQWEAKKQYLLTLGNTHAVRVLLNGREIETDRAHQLLTDWVIDASLLP